jgi:alkyl hydroperoxide reductase subunit F
VKALQGVFVQIGLVPNSSVLKGVVDLTKHGEVIINEKSQTSEAGIYACGDVTTVPYKQIVIAMGEGAKASLAAYDYILMSKPLKKTEAVAA